MGDFYVTETMSLVLSSMAWQRAKGELLATLQGYWEEQGHFEEVASLVDEFVKKMDSLME